MDFRKLVLVLAILALAIVPASAQVCTTTGTNTLMRAEGLAELAGDMVLDCTGPAVAGTGNAGAVITTNIQLILNTFVTSRLTSATTGASEALLILDEGVVNAAGGVVYTPGVNVFQGTVVGNNFIQFTGVPVQVPTSSASTRRLRFTNVRADAALLSTGTSSFLPGQVIEQVTFTGTQPFSVPVPQAVVGSVVPGITVDLRTADNSAAASTHSAFPQCSSNNSAIAGDNTKTATLDFLIRFKEGFPSAFKPVGPGSTAVNTPTFTESGLLGSAVGYTDARATTIGQATQGTRLYATFSNIPAGVQIFVTTQPVVNIPAGFSAFWVGQDPTAGGTTGVVPTAAATGAVTGTVLTPAITLAPVTLSGATATTGATGSAVWEVASADPTVTDDPTFGVVVAYTANTSSNLPGLTITNAGTTPATAAGGYAPTSALTTASFTAPVPRFVANPTQTTLFNIAACVTNLLFPFVTNQAGFDTGIALVNTSLDNSGNKLPFNTSTQHGTCTVYYFGAMAGGGALPAPQTTADIAAGQSVAFNLNGGGVPGATSSAAGFQGYIIARCAFQYAHGYAFISNLGVSAGNPANFAQGYIALVIPDRGGSRPAANFTTGGTGEQLAY